MKLNRMSQRKHKLLAFTLIELLVVIIILGVLAALIIPKVIGRTSDAKITAAKSDLSSLHQALNMFKLDCGRYPTTDEGLNALVTQPSGLDGKWKGPYLEKLPNDPWNNAYIYKTPGDNGTDFTLESYGSDGTPGGTGDAADILDPTN